MATFTVAVTGTAPMLMHSARLADPLDPATRALARVTGKRSKTEDDHREAARLEFLGGLYIDDALGPYVPGANMEACLFRAASKSKLMSTLKTALIIPDEVNPLAYRGPRTADALAADETFAHRSSVKVGKSRVVRTRPIFRTWSVEFVGELDTDIVDKDVFEGIAATAGRLIGLGDWRPRFGRFEAEVTWK